MKLHTLDSKIVELLKEALQHEYSAHYMYRAMSNWTTNVGYKLAGGYFAKEAEDELAHAQKIESFLTDWNVFFVLPKVDIPIAKFEDLQEAIEKSYSVEYALYEVYEQISNEIFKMGDTCVFDFLQFFRSVQTKAVAEYATMLNLLEGVERAKLNFLLLEEKLFE
jgi:ferritin